MNFFNNDSNSNKANKQRRGRQCRIEELEGREMLSASPWTLAEPQSLDYDSAAVFTPFALAPLGDEGDAEAPTLSVVDDYTTPYTVTLQWSMEYPSNVESFLVEYKRSDATEWIEYVSLGSWASAASLGLTPDTSYDFRVTAIYSDGEEVPSNIVTQKTNETPKLDDQYMPFGFTCIDASPDSVTFRWNYPKRWYVSTYEIQYREVGSTGDWTFERSYYYSNRMTIGELTAGKTYEFQIRAVDTDGGYGYGVSDWSASLTVKATPPIYHNDDLEVVERLGLEDYVSWCVVVDTYRVYEIWTDEYSASSELTGVFDLRTFTELQRAYFNGTNITSLDVSGLKKLAELECGGGWDDASRAYVPGILETINVTGCTALEDLDLRDNKLTVLDLTGCTSLRWLSCGGNQLKSLDTSACADLSELYLNGNQLSFKTLILPPGGNVEVNGVQTVTISMTGNTVDLSAYVIAGVEYAWYDANTGAEIPSTAYTMGAEGVFTFTGVTNKAVYCVMMHENFSGYYESETFMVATTPVTFGTPVIPQTPGSTLATAANVTFTNGKFNNVGTFTTYKDVHVYKITVAAADVGKRFSVTTSRMPGINYAYPYLRLLDANGNELRYSWESFRFVPDAAGVYYLELRADDYEGSLGKYALEIAMTAIPPAPAGYNENDWNKLSMLESWYTWGWNFSEEDPTADGRVEWEEIGDVKRLVSLNVTNSNLVGTLNLSGCTELETLYCDYSHYLTTIDVSGCTSLETLLVSGFNRLTTLNVSGCTALMVLNCSYTQQLSKLDVSTCSALEQLSCWGSSLRFSTLTLPANPSSDFTIDGSMQMSIPSMPVVENTIDLSSENVGGKTTYTWYYDVKNEEGYHETKEVPAGSITQTSPGKFTFSGLTANVWCEMTNENYPEITLTTTEMVVGSIDSYDKNKVEAAKKNNGLLDEHVTWTEIEGVMRLTGIDVSGRDLNGSLDLSGCTGLEYVYVAGYDLSGNLTGLNVSGCTALQMLRCHDNQLKTLNVAGCTSLEYLSCQYNQLTTLNVTGLTNLENLYCYRNQLTSLNVSGCTNLQNLDCESNQLTSLNVTGLTKLIELQCSGNKLTSLDASGLANLEWLHCVENQLTSLNVDGCTKLRRLGARDNQLTSLDISACTDMRNLNVTNNQLKFSTFKLPPDSDGISYGLNSKQADIRIPLEIGPDNSIDLSSEYLGGKTTYTWYANGTKVDSANVTNTNGRFTFTGLDAGAVLYCVMSNDDYSMSLQTTRVTIVETAIVKPTAAPSNFKSTGKTANSVTFEWDAVAGAYYEIQYWTGTVQKVTRSFTGTSGTISGLVDGTTYQFQIRAVNAEGESDWSAAISVKASDPPVVPTKPVITADATATSVTIAIPSGAGKTFEIQYGVEGKNGKAPKTWITYTGDVVTLSGNTVTVGGLVAGTNYQFRIREVVSAEGKIEYSDWSDVMKKSTTGSATVLTGNENKVDKASAANKTNRNASTTDSVTVSWGKTGTLTTYIVTYTIPSGIKGIPGTVVQDIVTLTSDTAGTTTGNGVVTVSGTTITYKIDGLVAGATYKVSIVGQNDAGATTKAVSVSQKATKLAAAPKKFVADGKPTIDSVKLKWDAASGAAGYVIEVWSPKTKTEAAKLVQVIEVGAVTGTTINDLKAGTKYTFAVKAVDATGKDLTAFASKAISTAKWAAPSKLKLNAIDMTVTGSIPKEAAWTKNSVNGSLSRVDAYSQFAVYYLNNAKQEVLLGFVGAAVDGTANKVTSESLSALLANVNQSSVPAKVSFIFKAVVPTDAAVESDIVNNSLSGKFTVKKSDLP